jgi:hypothetical protein
MSKKFYVQVPLQLCIIAIMRNILLFTIATFGSFMAFPVIAQLDNSPFYEIRKLNGADSNTLKLEIDALAFTKNHEYFNDIADGYTLFGYQFAPVVTYQPLKNFSVSGGIFLRKDFGNNDFKIVEPLFRFIYQRDSMQLIFGNLNGALAHRLIEPLYDFDRALVNPIENGMQFRYFSDAWWVDAWIDWQRMIYEGDPEQEEVTGGLSYEKAFFKESPVQLNVPVQALVYHKGGQIDTSPDPLVTLWNSAVGVKIGGSPSGFIKRWQGSAYYAYYKDFSHIKRQPFKDGDGIYINGSVTTSFDLQMMLSYWRGDEFISIMGGQLYPSVSSTFKKPYVTEEHRDLLILRFTHELHLYRGIYITSRFEPYYDFLNKTFEFSHGLYISYKQPVMLLKNVMK